MKKTQRKELFANIRKSKVSFISITMFIILGITIYLGLGWVSNDLKQAINKEDARGNAHDVELFFPYGISDSDLTSLNNVEQIEAYEPYFVGYESFTLDNILLEAKLVSYNKTIDKLFDLEGRLPQNENEIIAERGSAIRAGIEIGDTIEFFGDEANTSYFLNELKKDPDVVIEEFGDLTEVNKNYLKNNKVTVVGIAESPEYISISDTAYGQSTFSNAQVNAVFFVDYSLFNEDIVGPYNYVTIKYKGLKDLLYNSTEYSDAVNKINEELKDVFNNLSNGSYSNIKDSYENLDARLLKELNDAKKKIEDGKIEIATNEKKLADGKIELDKGKILLDEGREQLDDAKAELYAGESEYNYMVNLVNKVESTYNKHSTSIANLQSDPITEANIPDFIDIFSDEDIYGFGELMGKRKVSIDDIDNFKVTEYEQAAYKSLDALYAYFYLYSKDIISNLGNANEAYKDSDDDAYEAALEVYKTYPAFVPTNPNDVPSDSIEMKEVVVMSACYGNNSYAKKMEKAYNDRVNPESPLSTCETTFMTEATAHKASLVVNSSAPIISKAVLDIYNNAIPAAKAALIDARAQLDDGWRQYYDGEYEYAIAFDKYNTGLNDYNSGIKKLNQAKIDIAEGEIEYADGLEAYDLFKEKAGELKDFGTIALTQLDNTAMMYNNMLSEIIAKVKLILGGLFLLIGLMVCYSVVTRMVNNDIKLIGTKKALGFNRREITVHYLCYTAISTIVGGVLGVAIAYYVVEPMVAPQVSVTFTLEVAGKYFGLGEFLGLLGVEFLLIEAITYLACYKLLKKDAIKLLQGNSVNLNKEHFYEKLRIYQKQSLLTKTIINNFFNDRSRILATLIGIAGSTALIVSSLMMRQNVLDCFNSQFHEYLIMDSFIYFDQNNDNAKDNIYKVLDKYEITYTPVERQFGYSEKDGYFSNLFTYIMVYDENDPNFEKLVHFASVDGETFENGETWMSNAVQQYTNLGNKSTINYRAMGGGEGSIDIDGFYNYYYYSAMIFMPKNTYKEIFNEDSVENVILIDTDGIDQDELLEDLRATDGYQNYLNYEEHVGEDADVFKTIASALVGVYVAAATMMAIFVILNLLITFVNEKKKELIVLMINGFSVSEAKRYIYSDTLLITLAGIIVGSILGTMAGDLSITSFEGIYIYLTHKPNVPSILIGSGITVILTIIMSLIALKEIEKFRLTEINKD